MLDGKNTLAALQGLPLPGPLVPDQRPTMIDPAHATVPPCSRGVVQLLLRVNGVNQNGGPVRSRPADNHTLSIDDETGPSMSPTRIGRAHREVVASGRSLQCRGNVGHVLIIVLSLHARIVEGNKHELHSTSLIFTEKLRVPEVVADEKSTSDISYFKGYESFARTIIFQITVFLVAAGAEHLVIAIHQSSLIVDDVERVVRFMLS